MRDQMRFVNHLGEVIEFGKGNVLINENDFRDYEWEHSEQNNKRISFKKKIVQKELPVIIYGEDTRSIANKIFEIVEKDIIAGVPGKMFVGDYYIHGYIQSSSYSGYTLQKSINLSLKFVSDNSMWTRILRKEFYSEAKENVSSDLDFPTDFPFDFASETGIARWTIDHYAPSDFKAIVYGPCINPKILINKYPYQVFTELSSREYLILDTRDHTVVKHLQNGEVENLYNSRQFTPSVFAKIPGGNLVLNWSGKFGFDLEVYTERSEPKW